MKLNEKILELLNITEQDFEQKPDEDKDRIEILEEAVLELAEIIGGDSNG